MVLRLCVPAVILSLALLLQVGRTHGSSSCTPDSTTGLYGKETNFIKVVEYDYELTVQPGYDLNKVLATIIPDLETTFSTAILKTLFAMDCGSEESSNVGGVDGLSTLGVDTIKTGESCTLSTTTDNSTTTCYVMNGEVTVYTSHSSALDYSADVLKILKAGMDTNAFVIADSIENVGFIDSTVAPTEQTQKDKVLDAARPFVDAVRGSTILYWVVIFSPFICLCVYCFGYGLLGGNRGGGEQRDEQKRGITDDDTESLAERGIGADWDLDEVSDEDDDGSDDDGSDDDGSDDDRSDDDGSDDDGSGDESDFSDYESD